MPIFHEQVRPGEGFMQVARRLSPAGVDQAALFKFAQAIAATSGLTLSSKLYVGQALHVDDATIPAAPPPPKPEPAAGFYVKNGRIGRGGKQFVPIGLNGVPTARSAPAGTWWNDTGMAVLNGRSQLYVDQGYNFVRVNIMRDYGAYSFDDYQAGLFDCVDEYLARGIVVMIASHQIGPGTNPTPAQLAANTDFQNTWAQIAARYSKNPMVWANPLNEPIGSAWDQWEALAEYQYQLLRTTFGWPGIIVIDLPQWAQGIAYAADRAPGWVLKRTTNCVLGFHNYAMGDASATIRRAQEQGVALVVGEAGATLGEGTTTSFEATLAQADELGVGCVFWWGAGNRHDSYVLRNRTGSAFYDTAVGPSVAGAKMFALAKNRPVQPNL